MQPLSSFRKPGRWARTVLAAGLAAGCLLAQPVSADATSSADRASTDAYLRATYTLDLALIQNTAKTSAGLKQASAAVAAECPMALAHAPGESGNRPNTSSPRARGEADRQRHQYEDLTEELETALRATAFQIDGQTFATFAAEVTPLHWSNPAIARAIQSEIQLGRTSFEPGPAPEVCADMRAWATSGYQTLSAGTKAYEIEQQRQFASSTLTEPSEALLKPYESAREWAIIERREALPTPELFELDRSATTKLEQRLSGEGETSGIFEVTSSKVFGAGRTHTGAIYKAEADSGFRSNCEHAVSFSVTREPGGGLTIISSAGTGELCLSGKEPAATPRVTCNEGLLQIESSTLAQTRRVRLKLSNGHTILSSAIPVPRKYGGPAGVYFQMLRGSSPDPVSLSELDAGGHVTRTVALRAVRNCHAAAPKFAFRQIVNGKSSSGKSFSVSGSTNNEHGHHTFDLEAEGPAFSNGSGASASLEPPSSAQATDFPLQIAVGCEPHPFALVYGRLNAPGATVLVATATTPLAPLTQVQIPSALHTPGMLAYSLLDALPTELVVTSSTGATLLKVDLRARAKSETEYCEGYVEG